MQIAKKMQNFLKKYIFRNYRHLWADKYFHSFSRKTLESNIVVVAKHKIWYYVFFQFGYKKVCVTLCTIYIATITLLILLINLNMFRFMGLEEDIYFWTSYLLHTDATASCFHHSFYVIYHVLIQYNFVLRYERRCSMKHRISKA